MRQRLFGKNPDPREKRKGWKIERICKIKQIVRHYTVVVGNNQCSSFGGLGFQYYHIFWRLLQVRSLFLLLCMTLSHARRRCTQLIINILFTVVPYPRAVLPSQIPTSPILCSQKIAKQRAGISYLRYYCSDQLQRDDHEAYACTHAWKSNFFAFKMSMTFLYS